MPVKLERCVKAIKNKLKKKEISKHYIKKGKKYKTSAWAICKTTLAKKKQKRRK